MGHPYMAIQERAKQRAERQVNGGHIAAYEPDEQIVQQADEQTGAQTDEQTEAQMGRKSIIRWTENERVQLAMATRELRAENPGLTHLEAVRIAQEKTLPEHRRRPLGQSRQVEDIVALIRELAHDQATEQAREQAREQQIRALVEPPKPAPIETQEAKKARKKLVRWTAEEKRVIALESKRLLASFADMKPLEAIRKAIDYKMPPDRQRTIDALATVDWIEREWQSIDDHERAERAEREQVERAEQVEANRQHEAQAIDEAHAEAQRHTAQAPASMPLETLIGALGAKVAGMVLNSIGEHLQESIMQRISEAIGHMPMPAAQPQIRLHVAPRTRKARVLIVGLINQQAQDMMHAMGEVLSLDFVKSEHLNMLEDKARHADLVVLMTKFISHKHQDIVQRVNEHVVYRNGGVSELKRWLTQWINGETAPA